MTTPTVGQIVHYARRDSAELDAQCCAAIVTDLYGGPVVDLMIWPPASTLYRDQVSHDPELADDTWHRLDEC